MRLSYLILDHVTYHVSYHVIMFQVYDYIIYFQHFVFMQFLLPSLNFFYHLARAVVLLAT